MDHNTCTVEELHTALQSGATVLDVRERDEFAECHVPQATLLPLSELPAKLHEVPQAEPLYIICRSGRRSITAGEMIAAHAPVNWINVEGGTLAWIDAGYETATGSQQHPGQSTL